MNITTFAKPGEKNVISPDYNRPVTIEGKRLVVSLMTSCWHRGSRLGISVSGAIGSGEYESRRLFENATMADIDRLIKRVKFARCSETRCNRLYLDADDLALRNPNRLCRKHWQARFQTEVDALEAEEKARIDKEHSQKKARGFRYKGVVWIHRDSANDYAIVTYFKNRPTRRRLVAMARRRRSRLLHDYRITKL